MSSSSEYSETNNEEICQLFKSHYKKKFYDRLAIPFNSFRENNWDIEKTLRQSKYILFFNKNYLTDDDIIFFYQVFNCYNDLLGNILSTENKHYRLLEKWSVGNDSYLKRTITKKYPEISPIYCVQTYSKYRKKYVNNDKKFEKKFYQKLDIIIKEYKIKKILFKNRIEALVDSYVFERPVITQKELQETFFKSFINGILINLFIFAQEMIDLNIYLIHDIISDIMSKYLDLNDLDNLICV
ncbi:MAG: hypothetical protein H0X03_07100 [Nitrosopumilus sp.]|nr:hypothetical protein [Nitrosopumilus sp.]